MLPRIAHMYKIGEWSIIGGDFLNDTDRTEGIDLTVLPYTQADIYDLFFSRRDKHKFVWFVS
jgi:hypothetical protein